MEPQVAAQEELLGVPVVQLADLPKYAQKTIAIVPSGLPGDIFERMGAENYFIRAYARNHYGTRQYPVHREAELIDNVYYSSWASNLEKIHVILPPDTQLRPVAQSGNRNAKPKGSIGTLDIEISWYAMRDDKYKKPIIERDGRFFVDVFGFEFPAEGYIEEKRDYYQNVIKDVHRVTSSLSSVPGRFVDVDQVNRFISKIVSAEDLDAVQTSGIAKTHKAVEAFYKASPSAFSRVAYKIAADNSHRAIKNVKFSVIFNKMFAGVTTQEAFDAKASQLAMVLKDNNNSHDSYLVALLDQVDEARELQKTALQRKSTGAFNKIMDDLDFVKIDEATHPLTHAAVFGGTLPLGTFFRKNGDSYFMYNDNWDLWEEMLAAHHDLAVEIASEAARRTTFEKDIMSYFYFVLHGLPEYLEAHTGAKWTGIPKLVKSSSELEPPKAGSSGTAKTRSAMTPIVDNENRTITVPYVSMATAGYSTTYTYALDFNVLRRGFNFQGYTVTKDVETRLNGRDDYGLMFYTLTGSDNGRGYPSFLIIFERLDESTKVHFHRTHPMRSKQGEGNPVHNWTKGCYQWMIGNVNFDRIKAQQGDLAFVAIDEVPADAAKAGAVEANQYEGHHFGVPVPLYPYVKKDNQNVLGYVTLERDTDLLHEEHRNRVIPAGVYEIRQCRSWEANPKGVWSLRID